MTNLSETRQWVLIRGIMSESFHWWDFIPRLEDHFKNDLFYTADILGNGRNNHVYTPINVLSNIEGLKRQVPKVGKKILVGFSLGAMLSLEWAHLYPDEIEAVILINCSLNNSSFFERMQPSSLAQIFKLSLTRDMIEREKHTLRMTTAQLSEEQIHEIAGHWGPRGLQFPVKTVNFIRQGLVAMQIPQRSHPPAPTLILTSGKDKVVHPICSERIAKKWGLPHHRHPDAGHDLSLDAPDWTLEKIEQFIDGINNKTTHARPTVEGLYHTDGPTARSKEVSG